MTVLIDTNLIIRYLVDDDPKKSQAVERLLTQTGNKLVLLDIAFAEIVWVLQSYYGLSKGEISEKLNALLIVKSLQTNRTLLLRSLKFFAESSLSFIDSYQAAYALLHGLDIYSYDRDFTKIKGIRRLEP